MPGTLLFMDNQPSVVDKWCSLLEQDGYRVLRATTLEEAEKILRNGYVHLAILDIRMQSENDENDLSGLVLAQKPEFRSIPKIILTAYPSFQYVRDVMTPDAEGRTAALNFVEKGEGPEALERAIEQAFDEQIRTDWNLEIHADERKGLSFRHLASLLEPARRPERQPERQPDTAADATGPRAVELEDLFRRLFYGYRQMRIGWRLWQTGQRVCLAVLARSPQGAVDPRIVVCGERDRLAEEVKLVRELAPDAVDHTRLAGTAETTHLGAAAYLLSGADPDTLQPLGTLVESGGRPDRRAAFDHLLTQVLPAWHRRGEKLEEGCDLMALYRERAGLGDGGQDRPEVEHRVRALAEVIRPLGTIAPGWGEDSLTLRFPNQPPLESPDPIAAVYDVLPGHEAAALCRVSPGRLTADNVLVDAEQRAWLTDFARAGQAPQWWDFVCLEAALRFDLSQAPDMMAWQDLEECLTAAAGLDAELPLEAVVRDLQNHVGAIEWIRHGAAAEAGRDPLPYHAGLLVWAVAFMAQYDPGGLHTRAERLRAAHLLLAAALLAQWIAAPPDWRKASSSPGGDLYLGDDGVRLWRGGQRLPGLGEYERELFRCLDARAGQVVSRQVLIEQVYGEVYLGDKSQEDRLTALVARLRRKIEPDPAHPRHLLTSRGTGYLLEKKSD
jgi:DNA-binding response OmpR family regulator